MESIGINVEVLFINVSLENMRNLLPSWSVLLSTGILGGELARYNSEK